MQTKKRSKTPTEEDENKRATKKIKILSQKIPSWNIIKTPFYIEGCTGVQWMRVEGRNQYILIIGENHQDKGNSIELIKHLADSTNCPIDVIIEDQYESYWNEELGYTQSNSTRFRAEKKRVCYDPRQIPSSPRKISRSSDFYKTCIRPYQGRLKIWAEDIRSTSIFKMFLDATFKVFNKYARKRVDLDEIEHDFNLLYETDRQFRQWFTRVKRVMKSFFHFNLYHKDASKYHDTILKELRLLFQTEGNPINNQWFLHHLDLVLKSRDKSHMTFARDMTRHFSSSYLNKLKRYVDQEIDNGLFFDTLLNAIIFDVAILLRIQKILRKQKEGLIVCFVGYNHLLNLEEIMKIKELGHLRMVDIQYFDCDPTTKHFSWTNPLSFCMDETQLMKKYNQLSPKFTMGKT